MNAGSCIQEDQPPHPAAASPPLQSLNSSSEVAHQFRAVFTPDARSNSATRASMSSISIAFVVCDRTMSAARSRVDAGTQPATIIFKHVVTAAPKACCNRATDCRKASRRASFFPRENFYIAYVDIRLAEDAPLTSTEQAVREAQTVV